jgi:outer membrane protein assembly factor BamA
MMRCARAAALVVAVALVGVVAAAPPAGKEIAEVLVSGNHIRQTHDIIAVFGLRPEQKYDEEAIRAGTKRLYDKGWFTPNGIEIRTVERTDGRINVILYVTELSNFIEEIKYNGAQHLSPDELAKITGLRVRMPMSPHLNQQARLNILRKYQEDGRVHASVTIKEGTKLDDRRVVFDIVEGPKVKISDVDFKFVGAHESGISSGRLREQLTISRAKLGDRQRRQGPDPLLPRARLPGLPGRPGSRSDGRSELRECHLLRRRGAAVQGRPGADQRELGVR